MVNDVYSRFFLAISRAISIYMLDYLEIIAYSKNISDETFLYDIYNVYKGTVSSEPFNIYRGWIHSSYIIFISIALM